MVFIANAIGILQDDADIVILFVCYFIADWLEESFMCLIVLRIGWVMLWSDLSGEVCGWDGMDGGGVWGLG